MFKTRDQAAGYLGGLIDGEGHIAHYYSKGAWCSRHIAISNTEPSIMNAAARACDMLELSYTIKDYTYGKKGKSEYRLHIYGHVNCKLVLDHVPIMCTYKQEKLQEVVASFERSMQRRQEGRRSFVDVKGVVGPWQS